MMEKQREIGYILFNLVSLLTFMCEWTFNCILIYHVYLNFDVSWTVAILCLLAATSIALQLISFIFQQRNRSPDTKWCSDVSIACVHILQFALPWRYVRLLLGRHIELGSTEVWEGYALRLLHAVCSTLPLLHVHVYLLLQHMESISAHWPLIAATVCCLVSAAWSLATFQRRSQPVCMGVGAYPSWVGTGVRLVWRVGELVARVLALALFALVHRLWVFLVLGFHWLTMLLLLLVDQLLQNSESDQKTKIGLGLLCKSYVYVFSHVSLTARKSKYGFVFFYIISCLESIALLALWIIYDDRTKYHMPFGITVAGGYIIALIFALIYYNCVHLRSTAKKDPTQSSAVNKNLSSSHQCVECRFDDITPTPDPPLQVDAGKPWLQLSPCPHERFLRDNTIHSDANSGRSSDILVSVKHSHIQTNGSLGVAKPRHLLRLDARDLPGVRCQCGSDVSSDRGSRAGKHRRSEPGVLNPGLDWDDYDLQLRETPEGASNPEIHCKDSPRSLGTLPSGPLQPNKKLSIGGDSTKEGNITLDQGYFSTMSSLSKDNPQVPKTKDGVLQKGVVSSRKCLPGHVYTRACVGLADETGSSSMSATSSRVPILNCKRCGHCVSIDSVSMYSLTSNSTSMASSAYAKRHKYHRYGSMDYLDPSNRQLREQHKRDQRLSVGVTPGATVSALLNKRCASHNIDLQRPLPAQEPPRTGFAQNNSIRLMASDMSSATGWEGTDSEM